MEENRDRNEMCSICGEELSTEQQKQHALCSECTTAWEREVDSHW
jgi:uncharacterized CHY-type Zn-finger protein